MFKHILLAVDLGHEESWAKSLPYSVDYAKHCGATLHVMTVVPDYGMSIVGSFFPEGHEEKAVEAATKALHQFVADNVPKGIKVQHIVGHGTAYEEILRVGEEVGVDMIVMGSHRPKVQDYLLGPNAARVVRHAKCSVVVIRD